MLSPPSLILLVLAAAALTGVVSWRGRRERERLRALVAERSAALHESEERYRAVSDLNADTSFRVHIDRELRMRPEWACGGLAATPEPHAGELDDHGWLALLPEQDRTAMREGLAGLQVGNRFDYECTIRAPDGLPRTLATRVAAVARDPDGAVDLPGLRRRRHRTSMQVARRSGE